MTAVPPARDPGAAPSAEPQGPELLDTPSRARSWTLDRRRRGRTVALVPTMGALHDGHARLVQEARRHADDVIVSIFVNPMQFDRRDDFDRYPRTLDDDLALCARLGADAVYAPTAAAMYPEGFDTTVRAGRLADRYEGAHRPGHFDGVVTVVTKLFTATLPDLAVFGEKDAQQLAIVQRLAVDLDLGVRIVPVPTVRGHDGLALSSRNRRLDPDDRVAAVCIARGLDAAERVLADGTSDARAVVEAAREVIAAEPRARIEYVDLVDPERFEPITGPTDRGLVVAAVWFGDVRLIDNRRIDGHGDPYGGPHDADR